MITTIMILIKIMLILLIKIMLILLIKIMLILLIIITVGHIEQDLTMRSQRLRRYFKKNED